MKTSEDLLQKTNQILPKSMQLAENGEAALLQKSMGRFGPETFVRLSRAQVCVRACVSVSALP
eukprot:SAG31_NODE_377_length_16533_cov_99.867957_9_plen_63_part_00